VRKNINYNKFPSLKETYEEIREMYAYEQNRFLAIENKVTSFLSMNSFLAFIFSFAFISGYYIFIPSVILILISTYYSFRVLGLKKGRRPGKDYGDYYQYAKMSKQMFNDTILLAYVESLKVEGEINKNKVKNLNLVIHYSKFAWMSFFVGILHVLIA